MLKMLVQIRGLVDFILIKQLILPRQKMELHYSLIQKGIVMVMLWSMQMMDMEIEMLRIFYLKLEMQVVLILK